MKPKAGLCRRFRKVAIRLIINADDLGASALINNSIEACVQSGTVTSVSLLANGPVCDDAVAMIRKYPQCSVGVHLNAMEYRPLTNPDRLRPILTETGEFAGNLAQTPLTGPLREALVREWCIQIERVREAGVTVSHLDSHYHMHTVPSLFPVLREVVRTSSVKRVRLSKNLYSKAQPPASKSLLLKKRLWNSALRFVIDAHTTDAFTEFSTFLEIGRLQPPDVKTLEVMVHPGHHRYQEETVQLMGPWEKGLNFKVALISYHEI